jgi:predicted N-acetyltransferase YhbS
VGGVSVDTKQGSGRLTKPAALKPGHDLSTFDCGRPELTDWLKRRALRASETDTARTFVVCRGTKRVVGYCSLAAGAVARDEAPGGLARNAPDPVPVVVLARLAIDLPEQKQGLGELLLAEGMRRAALASKNIGARALLVHALDEQAALYYEGLGFRRFAPGAQTLYLPMKVIRDGL